MISSKTDDTGDRPMAAWGVHFPLESHGWPSDDPAGAVRASGDLRFGSADDGVPGFLPAAGDALTVDGWKPGEDGFGWSVWAHVPHDPADELGDVMSCFDPVARHGAHLGFADGHSTTSRVNAASVSFGVDWGSEPVWESLGRPDHSVGVLALAVHDGELYAGTLGDDGLGRVFVLRDGWEELPGVTSANCVSALASHDGALYAGTTRYRTGGSAMTLPPNDAPGGEVMRWDGAWVSTGALPGVDAIAALAVHRGRLYAAAMYQEGVSVLGPDGWESAGSPGRRVLTLGVNGGRLHAGGNDHADPDSAIDLTRKGVVVEARAQEGGGGVFALDPAEGWLSLGYQPDTTQVYSLTTSRERLVASTWPHGLVFEFGDGIWSSLGRLGDETEVMGLITYNGSLYGGTLPHAQVHRRDERGWTRVGTADVTPDALYRRAAGLALYGGGLAVGTLPSGAVHRMRVGDVAATDESLSPGWHHLAASCDHRHVTLWVDGRRVSTTRLPDAPREMLPAVSLVVGAGASKRYVGTLRDLRLIDRPLTTSDVRAIGVADDPRPSATQRRGGS